MTRIRQICTNTLCCEPFLRRMPNGELLCVVQCDGTDEPQPENRVYYFHSKDNGETWSQRTLLYPEEGKAVYCTELMVLGEEVTAFLTIHNGSFMWWKCVMMKSYDNGHTWENAGAPWHFPEYTFVRSMIKLSNGNILLPYQHYPITREDYMKAYEEVGANGNIAIACKSKICESGVLISSDGGRTFDRYKACDLGMINGNFTWSEPTVVELTDGRLVMIMRQDASGYLWRCDSEDGGKTWGEVSNTHIPNPGNKSRLFKLNNGRIALVHTPNNKDVDKKAYGYRSPYQIWITEDDMKTWSVKETISEFPGEYHYTDGFFEDGHLLLTVEHNRHTTLFIDYEV